jgi:hypothetical protein
MGSGGWGSTSGNLGEGKYSSRSWCIIPTCWWEGRSVETFSAQLSKGSEGEGHQEKHCKQFFHTCCFVFVNKD